MSSVSCLTVRRASCGVTCAALVLAGAAAAHAQPAATGNSGTPGRIDFGEANLPPATVEVDLTQAIFSDLFGLGDAAVAGVAETLLQSAGTDTGSDGTRLAAEQLQAARKILQLASDVVREVRVRVYEDLPDGSGQPVALVAQYDRQLRAGSWDTIVRVRDGEESVRVSLLRKDGAVRGVFVVVADGSDLVLANVVCDASPENVKKLTSAATKVGLDNGLGQVLEAKMRQLQRRMPPDAARPKQRGDAESVR